MVGALPLAGAVGIGAVGVGDAVPVPGAGAEVAQQQVAAVLARQTQRLVQVVPPGHLRHQPNNPLIPSLGLQVGSCDQKR